MNSVQNNMIALDQVVHLEEGGVRYLDIDGMPIQVRNCRVEELPEEHMRPNIWFSVYNRELTFSFSCLNRNRAISLGKLDERTTQVINLVPQQLDRASYINVKVKENRWIQGLLGKSREEAAEISKALRADLDRDLPQNLVTFNAETL